MQRVRIRVSKASALLFGYSPAVQMTEASMMPDFSLVALFTK